MHLQLQVRTSNGCTERTKSFGLTTADDDIPRLALFENSQNNSLLANLGEVEVVIDPALEPSSLPAANLRLPFRSVTHGTHTDTTCSNSRHSGEK